MFLFSEIAVVMICKILDAEVDHNDPGSLCSLFLGGWILCGEVVAIY